MSGLGAAPVSLARFDTSASASVNSHYEFFKTPPTETTELGSTIVSAQPLSISNNSTSLQCSLPASQDQTTDLTESYVVVEVKFSAKDKDPLAAATSGDLKVWPETNLAHSMFSRIGLALNETEVFHTSAYPQLAYTETLLHESRDAKMGVLTAEGWFTDSMVGKDQPELTAEDNPAVTARKKVLATSRVVRLILRPFTPFRNSRKRIPPGVSMRLTATRADISTFINSSEAAPDVMMDLLRFEWVVRRCFVNPSVIRALNSRLLEGAKHSLPMIRPRTRTFVIPSGVQSHRIVLEEKNFLPLKVCVGLVDQEALIGNFKKSQFNYKPYNANGFELLIDGVQVGKSMKCDFENGNAAEAYMQTISAIGQTSTRSGNGLSYSDFLDNKAIVVFALAEPQNKEWGEYLHVKRRGTAELLITFSTATTKALWAVITDTREDLLQIDLEGRIHMTEPAV